MGKEESKLTLWGGGGRGVSYGSKAKSALYATPQLENCAKFDQLLRLISNENKVDSNSGTVHIHLII